MATEQEQELARGIGLQIGNLLCMVLGALWQNGELTAAKASISFPEQIRNPHVEYCNRNGWSPRVLKSSSAIANAQFPDCMLFMIPIPLIDEVWAIVKQIRLDALTEMSQQARDGGNGVAAPPSP